jgi:glycerate 2-kinase
MDASSLAGKAPVGVARRAAAVGVPVVAVVGALRLAEGAAADAGIRAVHSAVAEAGSADQALADPPRWLRAAARRVVSTCFTGS